MLSDIISIALCPAAGLHFLFFFLFCFVVSILSSSLISDPSPSRKPNKKTFVGLTGVAHFQPRTQVVVVPRPCWIERMSGVASKSRENRSWQGSNAVRGKLCTRERLGAANVDSIALRLSIRNRSASTTNQNPSGAPPLEFIRTMRELSNFSRE